SGATQGRTAPGVEVVLVGGSLNREASSTLGPQAERNLSDVMVQKAFLGTRAMSLDPGVTDAWLEIARVKQARARAAREVILLADSSKWGHVAFAKIIPLSAVHTIVTDSG